MQETALTTHCCSMWFFKIGWSLMSSLVGSQIMFTDDDAALGLDGGGYDGPQFDRRGVPPSPSRQQGGGGRAPSREWQQEQRGGGDYF